MSCLWRHSWLLGGLVLAALANAFVKPVVAALSDGHWASNPMVPLLCLYVLVCLARRGASLQVTRGNVVVLSVALALIATPFSLAAWAAVSLIGLALWMTEDGDRATSQVLVVLGLHQPFLFALNSLLGDAVLATDAHLVAGLLSLLGEMPTISANSVSLGPEHRLIILTGCASITNLGTALLAWHVVTRFARPELGLRDAATAGAIAATVIVGNVVRLTLMAGSRERYEILHHGVGAELFNMITTVLVGILIVSRIGDRRRADG